MSVDDWILQSVAMKELGKLRVEKAVPAIRKIFEEGKNSWLKGQAMLTLAKIQGKEMIPTAQRATKESDPVLRRAALQTLDLVGGKTSVPVARELLKDPVMEVRAMAAALYASEFPEEAWPTVERLATLDKASISSDLIRALAHIGSKDALTRMEKLFHAPNANKRRGRDVIQALAVADDEAIPLLVRLTVHYSPKETEFQLGEKLLTPRDKTNVASSLKKMILAEETDFIGNAASLMAEVCPTHELGDMLSNSWRKRKDLPQDSIRSGLVALSKIDPTRYGPFFSHFLSSEDPTTRAMAVRCRGLIPDKALFEVFRAYVHDENAEVAQAALESLRRAPFDSTPREGLLAYLTQSFRSSDEKVLLAALDLLGKRGIFEEFDSALQVLQPFLDEGKSLKREAAAKALAEISHNQHLADIAAAQGFIGHWDVVGPFLNDNKNSGFSKVYPPEEKEDAESYKAEYRWEFGGGSANNRELELTWGKASVQNVQGEMHVAAQMPVPIRHAVAYAKTKIHSTGERTARLAIDMRERISQKVWVNEQVVADFTIQHNELGGSPAARNRSEPRHTRMVKINLKNGSNRLMVKTSTFGGDWWVGMRVLDESKNEKAKGVTLAVSNPKR
ncbi:MAG: HEAT repeat domain-containing protein [Opitutales bacterium]